MFLELIKETSAALGVNRSIESGQKSSNEEVLRTKNAIVIAFIASLIHFPLFFQSSEVKLYCY